MTEKDLMEATSYYLSEWEDEEVTEESVETPVEEVKEEPEESEEEEIKEETEEVEESSEESEDDEITEEEEPEDVVTEESVKTTKTPVMESIEDAASRMLISQEEWMDIL